MGGGGFPIDLVLFGMVAAFLVLRLRSILGRRTGYERPPEAYQRPVTSSGNLAPTIEGQAEPQVPSARTLPDPASPVGQTLMQMHEVSRDFDPAHFLAGAETAFRMIVAAFAEGNRDTLRALLSPETFAAFDSALTAREAAGHTQRTEIRSIEQALIETAELRGSIASITMRFVSDQTNVTLDQAGQPVAGADAVTEITDLWTFERDLTTADPTWRLVAARSA